VTEIVAEISGNHGGSLDNAIKLIHAAKTCGADAVKFQCFEPDRLAMKRARQLGDTYEGRPLVELYRETHTPKSWFPKLSTEAELVGIPWFSSVFDPADVAFLKLLGCPRYKISAFEMLDGDLINAVVATGAPIVMSVRSSAQATVLIATPYNGLSDHTGDIETAVLYSKLGSPMIEAHLRLPDVETVDAKFSLTPEEFAAYVKAIRGVK